MPKAASFQSSLRILTITTLTLMFTIGAMVKLIVNLSGVFTTETKIAGDFLQRSAISYHHVEALKRIRTIFFFKFPLEFISRLDIKLVAPVRHCRSADIEQTSNLCIS